MELRDRWRVDHRLIRNYFEAPGFANMSATIIPFPSQRFTAVDADRLKDLASAMIAIGAWGRVEYLSHSAAQGLGFESVLIYLPDGGYPIFVIERQRNGNYSLIDCATMAVLTNAKTLGGALAPLKPVIRLAETCGSSDPPRKLQWNLW